MSADHDGPTRDEDAVLFPVTEGAHASDAPGLAVAAELARDAGADLVVLVTATFPEQTPFVTAARTVADQRALARTLAGVAGESSVEARGKVVVGRSHADTVLAAAAEPEVRTLVVSAAPSGRTLLGVGRTATGKLGRRADCDVVVTGGAVDLATTSSVLVPVAEGPHSGLAVDVSRALARAAGAWVELLHVVPSDADENRRRRGECVLAASEERLDGFDDASTWLLEAADPVDAIVEQSRYYDLTVIGAPRKGRLRRFVSGSTAREIRSGANGDVLTVRRNREGSWLARWFGRGT